MGFFHEYPYTDFHEINLDWILKQIMKLHKDYDEFKALNTITFSGVWDITKQYTAWTIVNTNNGRDGYISIQPVPSGVTINNTDYWQSVANYSDIIADLQNRLLQAENDIDDLENDVSGLDTDVSNLKTNVSELIDPTEKYITSFTALGSLNALMHTDDDGFLYVCNHDQNKISIYDTSNATAPVLIGSFATKSAPRDCARLNSYMVVACTTANTLSLYDISNPGATLTTDYSLYDLSITTPKAITIIDDTTLLVAHNGGISKVSVDLNALTMSVVANRSISANMLKASYNGFGCYAAIGQTNNIYLINRAMTNAWTLSLPAGASCAYCEYISGNYLLVTDHATGKLYVINTASITSPSIAAVLDLNITSPEQVYIVEKRAYIPELTNSGVPCKLAVVDIENPQSPELIKTIDLTGYGAGFIAGVKDYIYIDFHFSNAIDVIYTGRDPK